MAQVQIIVLLALAATMFMVSVSTMEIEQIQGPNGLVKGSINILCGLQSVIVINTIFRQAMEVTIVFSSVA